MRRALMFANENSDQVGQRLRRAQELNSRVTVLHCLEHLLKQCEHLRSVSDVNDRMFGSNIQLLERCLQQDSLSMKPKDGPGPQFITAISVRHLRRHNDQVTCLHSMQTSGHLTPARTPGAIDEDRLIYTFRTLPQMTGRSRKKTDIGRNESARQRLFARRRNHRTRQDNNPLPRETFAFLGSLHCQRRSFHESRPFCQHVGK